MVSLRIQLFWQVTPCQITNSYKSTCHNISEAWTFSMQTYNKIDFKLLPIYMVAKTVKVKSKNFSGIFLWMAKDISKQKIPWNSATQLSITGIKPVTSPRIWVHCSRWTLWITYLLHISFIYVVHLARTGRCNLLKNLEANMLVIATVTSHHKHNLHISDFTEL